MNCDIKTVIAILYKQLVSSSVNTSQALVDMLFKSYFNDPTSPEYDRSEPSKLNNALARYPLISRIFMCERISLFCSVILKVC